MSQLRFGADSGSRTFERRPCYRARWQHGHVRATAPKTDLRGRLLIYAVGADVERESAAPVRLRYVLSRSVVAAVAVLTAVLGSGAIAVWLVLAPVIPSSGVTAELVHPVPSRLTPPGPDQAQNPAEVGQPDASVAATPAVAAADSTVRTVRPAVKIESDRSLQAPHVQEKSGPTLSAQTFQRLRCAHNAASVR